MLIYSATLCEKISIWTTDASTNNDYSSYIDNVFGIYLFLYVDGSGNAVYNATIDGVNQYLYKTVTYWMVCK